MAYVFVTRHIPEIGIQRLKDAGHDVVVSKKDGVLHKEELVAELRKEEYEAVLCLLTDTIDAEVMDAAPSVKVFSNYAVGYNNIDIKEAKKRGIVVTNTPDVLTQTVAEYTIALVLALMHRIPEADRFVRRGKFDGWAPELLLGRNLASSTFGILGTGRIGSQVARYAHSFGADIIYNDLQRNEELEKKTGATFIKHVDDMFEQADVLSVHVPLLDSTHHLVNKERLLSMQEHAYLINTSRGPVIDEKALVEVLRAKKIRGAALDVFEDEPDLTPGLVELENVILTPHIASATESTRGEMAELAAKNIIDTLSGKEPAHVIG